MVRVLLDPRGRLVELRAQPATSAGEDDETPAGEPPAGDTPTDDTPPGETPTGEPPTGLKPLGWQPLWSAAGLRQQELATAEPAALPPGYADRRAAWTVEGSGSPRRVEAAALDGRPIFFEVRSEGEEPEEPPFFDWDLLWGWYILGEEISWYVLVLGAVLLARLNLRAGRGDLPGARHLAIFVVALQAAAWLLEADHIPPIGELARWKLMLGRILLEALVAWLS